MDKQIDWANAGGPNECKHGYAAGLRCPECERPSPESTEAMCICGHPQSGHRGRDGFSEGEPGVFECGWEKAPGVECPCDDFEPASQTAPVPAAPSEESQPFCVCWEVGDDICAVQCDYCANGCTDADFAAASRVEEAPAAPPNCPYCNEPMKAGEVKEMVTTESLLKRFVEVYGELRVPDSSKAEAAQLWHDYFEWTGKHWILSEEGWESGSVKQSYVEMYGPEDAILDEVNAPEAKGDHRG